MALIIHPSYFMDVYTVLQVYRHKKLEIDIHDSYVKQTYRSRAYIAASNGRLTLNIPIIHDGTGQSTLYQDVYLDQSQPWASNHLKSIASAYKNSPYFEYYEDDIVKLYEHIPDKLIDWNLKTMQWLLHQLYLDTPFAFTDSYQQDPMATFLITAKKKEQAALEPYPQVFQEKHGFLHPLSGLDLLFNLGPAARAYLKEQKVK